MAEVVTIDAIGHRGDGIVRGSSDPLYVPFTLPGERVLIEREGERGRVVELLEPSSERAAPVCRHFGTCGGCSLQMLPLQAARRLKREFVVAALSQQGLRPDVEETTGIDPGSRRRAVLTAMNVRGRLLLGYHERLSHRLVDVEECPVLVSAIAARLPALRKLLAPLIPPRRSVRTLVLQTAGGLDVTLEGARSPGPGSMAKLAQAARATGLARLSIDREPVLTLGEPAVEISGVQIVPPPGAFVQASVEAEVAMITLVNAHLGKAKRVADLFCGVGAFSFALMRHASVHAIDSNGDAVHALKEAANRMKSLKPITAERRDLHAFPLSPEELRSFDAVVFDPPYAGAKAQAAALATSRVPLVAAISCNPATFARDARMLVDGGYTLEHVVPVDQFVYSAETEVVGLFRRT
jgi:23S rRNA (uracil1939-C5)-methyltransferase